MANPYAGGGTAGAALASARGDMGDGNGASRAADLDARRTDLESRLMEIYEELE